MSWAEGKEKGTCLWKNGVNCRIRAGCDLGCLGLCQYHPTYAQVANITQVVRFRHVHGQRINLSIHRRESPKGTMGITHHGLLRGAHFVLVGSTVHMSALKTLGIGCIKLATRVMVGEVREVGAKTDGKAREDQAGGIEDPGAAASPAQRVGRVTRAPREKRVKWLPMVRARDCSRKLQERPPRHLTMFSMAAR